MKTYVPKKDEIEQKWYLVDAEGLPLGRLSSKIATLLRGKHKPYYTPFMDTGDYVICINAEKVKLTGVKWDTKIYWRHSGYMGGIKTRTAREIKEKYPQRIVEHAVKGMLPKGPLGRKMFKKLKVYAGPHHNHKSQKPEVIKI
ncbi:MAG: 50S ribosomal protein L13 [Desulfuromonas sp. SDB]|nr:MAG: 50S ribosomal protein L13 [Desulfuromonas sp. SDB]